MKKTLFFATIVAAVAMFTSCESDDSLSPDSLSSQTTEHVVFTASLPTTTLGSGTATVPHIKTTTINTDANDPNRGKVSWEQSDQITISDGTHTALYGIDTYDGGSAVLKYLSGDQLDYSVGTNYTATYGVAPSTEQTYSAEVTKLPMTATSTMTSTSNKLLLEFTVTCGVLKLNLTKAGESVKSIAVSDGTTTYTLTCTEAVSIASGADFCIALPAGTYTTFTIINSQDDSCIISYATGVTIAANTIQPLDFKSKLIFNEYEYVDLGLSVKWATCNIGASSPEDYGDYYAWGETETKSKYSWNNYKWCKGSNTSITKYCTNGSYGTVDNKTTLELSDDVARVKWGGSWRMPTMAEQQELIDNCTWTWTANYNSTGVKGYIVTSNTNSNSIFLPAAGYIYDASLNEAGSGGYYWSRSLFSGDTRAYRLNITSSSKNCSNGGYRYGGRSVRAVCP